MQPSQTTPRLNTLCRWSPSGLFQHPAGTGIVGKGFRIDALDIPNLEPLPADLPDCFGHNALTPIFLRQPVAQFRIFPVYVAPSRQCNASHCASVHLDSLEQAALVLRQTGFDKRLGILQGVGMGKYVPQILGNFFIICVFCHISGILTTPLPQNNIHSYSSQNSLWGFQPSTSGPSCPITFWGQTATTLMVSS